LGRPLLFSEKIDAFLFLCYHGLETQQKESFLMEYKELTHTRNSQNPFGKRLGIQVEEIGPGYARVTKAIGPEDLNPVGVPHGGVYFSVADTAAGSAMASHGCYAVTVNCSYNFLRSAKIGDLLTAEAREVKPGRTLAVFDVHITNQEDILVGTGTFTLYNLGKKIEL